MTSKDGKGNKNYMERLYPNPCLQGGYLQRCPWDHVEDLKWVWCDECPKNSHRCCKYNPRRTSIDTTLTNFGGFTFSFTHDFDSESDSESDFESESESESEPAK